MIRSELVRQISEEFPGLTQNDIDAIVTAFFDDITAHLEQGGRVELRGFGAFTTRAREGRMGRNPRTGSAVEVTPKRVTHFKPGKEIREKINS
jgi:integration host factor subunit beta